MRTFGLHYDQKATDGNSTSAEIEGLSRDIKNMVSKYLVLISIYERGFRGVQIFTRFNECSRSLAAVFHFERYGEPAL